MSARFHPRATSLVVPARVFGPSDDLAVRLLLDTGSAYTVLRRGLLERLGVDLSSPRSTVRKASATNETSAPLFTLRRIDALDSSRDGIAVIGLRLPSAVRADGVLGLNFLRGSRLVIDFRVGEILLD